MIQKRAIRTAAPVEEVGRARLNPWFIAALLLGVVFWSIVGLLLYFHALKSQ